MSPFRVLTLAASLAWAVTGSAQTILLRMKPALGSTTAYRMTLSMTQTAPGMPAPITFTEAVPMSIRVVKRTGGLTTLETKLGQAKVTVPANSPMAAAKATMEKASSNVTTTTVVDELGNLKNLNAAGNGAGAGMARQIGAGMMQGGQGVSYPSKPVKVGDTWSASIDMGKMMGASRMKASGKMPIVYKLTGIEKRGGKTLARLSVTMKGKTTMAAQGRSMDMVMSVRGNVLVDAATGLLQSMTNVTDTDMAVMGQRMRQHMVITMAAR